MLKRPRVSRWSLTSPHLPLLYSLVQGVQEQVSQYWSLNITAGGTLGDRPPPLTSKAERSPRKIPMCHSPAKASATTKEDKALGKNMRTRETTSSRSKNNNSTCTYHQDKALAKPPRPARARANTKKTKISSEHEGKENNPFSLNNKILYLYLYLPS